MYSQNLKFIACLKFMLCMIVILGNLQLVPYTYRKMCLKLRTVFFIITPDRIKLFS